MKKTILLLFSLLVILIPIKSFGNDLDKLKKRYTKREVMITMRDGVRLFTSIYEPKTKEPRPIIIRRTPYSCEPYGKEFRSNLINEWKNFADANYIIVVQDVRGHHRSEGVFEHIRPLNKNRQVKGGTATDEATDTYDTVEWLVNNTRNNGKVGCWGFSYDGFFSMMAGLSGHPAVVAVSLFSRQPPIPDIHRTYRDTQDAYFRTYSMERSCFITEPYLVNLNVEVEIEIVTITILDTFLGLPVNLLVASMYQEQIQSLNKSY